MKSFGSMGHFITRWLGRMGRSEAGEAGPDPGDGAVIHHCSGEADFDGSDGKDLPRTNDSNRDLPYPPKRSAD